MDEQVLRCSLQAPRLKPKPPVIATYKPPRAPLTREQLIEAVAGPVNKKLMNTIFWVCMAHGLIKWLEKKGWLLSHRALWLLPRMG